MVTNATMAAARPDTSQRRCGSIAIRCQLTMASRSPAPQLKTTDTITTWSGLHSATVDTTGLVGRFAASATGAAAGSHDGGCVLDGALRTEAHMRHPLPRAGASHRYRLLPDQLNRGAATRHRCEGIRAAPARRTTTCETPPDALTL